MVIGRLCCGGCRQIVKANASVVIGDLYTVAHAECFHLVDQESEMDSGKFDYIADKYFYPSQ